MGLLSALLRPLVWMGMVYQPSTPSWHALSPPGPWPVAPSPAVRASRPSTAASSPSLPANPPTPASSSGLQVVEVPVGAAVSCQYTISVTALDDCTAECHVKGYTSSIRKQQQHGLPLTERVFFQFLTLASDSVFSWRLCASKSVSGGSVVLFLMRSSSDELSTVGRATTGILPSSFQSPPCSRSG